MIAILVSCIASSVLSFFAGVWITRGKFTKLVMTEEVAETKIEDLKTQLKGQMGQIYRQDNVIADKSQRIDSLNNTIEIHENKEKNSIQKVQKALDAAKDLINILDASIPDQVEWSEESLEALRNPGPKNE